jgi:hypothetical protein
LPKRLLVDRQFIGRNGKLARPRHRSIRMPAYGGGRPSQFRTLPPAPWARPFIGTHG